MSRTETHDLMAFKAPEGAYVLSVYLQENAAKSKKFLKDRISTIEATFTEEVEQREFSECVDRVRQFLDRFEARAKTVVIVCSSTGPVWVRQVDVVLPNDVRWDTEPYWTPLVNAIDEFEPYTVVVVEKFSARFLTVSLGTTREVSTLQRRPDEELNDFLHRLIATTQDLLLTECPNRLIVAGDRDIRSEFLGLAPLALGKLVIGSIGVPKDASTKRVVELTANLENAAERRFKTNQVDDLIRLAKQHKKVAVGLASTLDALNDGRVWQLLYSEGFLSVGNRCEVCNGLFIDEVVVCPRCKVAIRPVADLMAQAVVRALRSDASIEQVRGTAAARLNSLGGIGAFLRY